MIGIITFHEAMNYGAVLQCYALQQAVLRMGTDNEIIDYHCKQVYDNERPLRLHDLRGYKSVVKFFLFNRDTIVKKKKFDEFRKKSLIVSYTKYSRENIQASQDQYSKYIVGSDQIWNTKLTDFDLTYYLDFVSDSFKKNSYAGSIGQFIDNEKNRAILQLLKDFNILTVREPEAKKIIKQVVLRNAEIVLDPTLLLSSQQWENVFERVSKRIKGKYILLYMIDRDERYFSKIRDFAKRRDLKIIFISNYIRPIKDVQMLKDIGPDEFVYLFKNADYVITGSFHGICFSIIFEKKFFYVLNAKSHKERLFNILMITGLMDRYIDNISDYVIDYDKSKRNLQPYIASSYDALKKIVRE